MCEDLAIEAERDTGHFLDMASLHRKHLDLLMCEEPMCLAILHMAFTVNCSHTLTIAPLTRLENSSHESRLRSYLIMKSWRIHKEGQDSIVVQLRLLESTSYDQGKVEKLRTVCVSLRILAPRNVARTKQGKSL